MATTVPDLVMAPSILPIARQYEAASFRAWPAASSTYDGAWITRLTPGHPSRRLNSVNFLDPADAANIPARVAVARQRFAEAGVPLAFRLTPLTAPEIADHFDREGWLVDAESIVMRANLAALAEIDAPDQIPLKDIAPFIEAAKRVRGEDDRRWTALAGVIGAIEPEAGLFIQEVDGEPVSSAICVHEGALAGLFDVVTASARRGKGHGRRLVVSALKWARLRGARFGWLQVDAENAAAITMYEKLGFSELYRYTIRKPRD